MKSYLNKSLTGIINVILYYSVLEINSPRSIYKSDACSNWTIINSFEGLRGALKARILALLTGLS